MTSNLKVTLTVIVCKFKFYPELTVKMFIFGAHLTDFTFIHSVQKCLRWPPVNNKTKQVYVIQQPISKAKLSLWLRLVHPHVFKNINQGGRCRISICSILTRFRSKCPMEPFLNLTLVLKNSTPCLLFKWICSFHKSILSIFVWSIVFDH